MIDSCLISWGKAILVNFPETEKVDGSNDWVTKPLWQSGGLQFLTFNKTEGGASLSSSAHRVLMIIG